MNWSIFREFVRLFHIIIDTYPIPSRLPTKTAKTRDCKVERYFHLRNSNRMCPIYEIVIFKVLTKLYAR